MVNTEFFSHIGRGGLDSGNWGYLYGLDRPFLGMAGKYCYCPDHRLAGRNPARIPCGGRDGIGPDWMYTV